MRFWLAALAEEDGAYSVLPHPWKVFSGITDVHKLHAGSIEVVVQTALTRLRQARIARYTNQEQQRHFPGDRGMEYGATVNEKPFYWGSPTPMPAQTGQSWDRGGDSSVAL